MRRLVAVLTAALFAVVPLVVPTSGALARRDVTKPAAIASPYELIVFEADGCNFCQNFRTDILPLYSASALGREAPIRFVNVSRSDETRMGLNSAITIAPTVVLMREGQEIDRIIGYTGPANFMKLVNFMMGREH